MSIAKYSYPAIDCPDPLALASFYSKLSGFEMEPLGDLDKAEAEVLALGATKSAFQLATNFRVYLDPVGHPFCLCLNQNVELFGYA